jgi:hypothetical protein
MKARMHTRPKGFDLDHVYKNFTRKPTDAENKQASWVPRKKSKA